MDRVENIRQLINDKYSDHVIEFRNFYDNTKEWYDTYQEVMFPVLMKYLNDNGTDDKSADFNIIKDLTYHSDQFVALVKQALNEYEAAYKTAMAVCTKAK